MTEAQVVALIAYRLGNIRNQEAAIKAQMYAIIEELEQSPFHPWFLLSENNHTQTVIGERRVPVPTDFLAEYEEGSLYLDNDTEWKELKKMSQDQLRECCSDPGKPSAYALTNSYFRLFPQPDAEYDLELMYYKKSSNVEGDLNPWIINAGNLLSWKVCAVMAASRKDMKASQGYEQKALAALYSLRQQHLERMETNKEVIFGG